MGMFDYFYSSYDLGEEFTSVECQTKDIDDYCGGTMSNYWLDPAGSLYLISYYSTHNFMPIEEGDSRHDPDRPFLNFEWIPTGERGRVEIHPLTKYIEIYPTNFRGEWVDWPRLRLHFRDGRLQDFTRIQN